MPLHIDNRPNELSEIIGNEESVAVLKSVIEREPEKRAHSFLFIGPSGCGKTTMARVLANELGCKDNDFNEFDSADFRGIDTVREIRKNLAFLPTSSDYRIYFLDECHKLTSDAQEALLKALEHPPEHIMIFLATTEPEKLKITLKRRCTEIKVDILDDEVILKELKRISRRERKRVPSDALDQIIIDACGSLGMALKILDTILDLPKEKMAKAAQTAANKMSQSIELCRILIKGRKGDWNKVAGILKDLQDEPESTRRMVLGYCNSILMKSYNEKAFYIMSCFQENFFNTGKAGLTMACFEALVGD